MKTCSTCHETKALDDFHADRSRPDGRQRTCKTCKTVEAAKRRQADLGRYAESQRNWRKANPQAAREIQKRSPLDPQHDAARRAVHEQIRLGVMVRPNICEQCHRESSTHAHHDDYSRPLDVRFLCPPCHLRAHGKVPRIDPSAVAS